MSNHFLSKGFSKNNDDDDIVKRQLSALGGTGGSDKGDSAGVEAFNDVSVQEQAVNTAETTEASATATTAAAAVSAADKSVLQQGLVVNGSISSQKALFVYGEVIGNIVCESDVTVDGKVDGNVSADNVQVLSGHIIGDIECKSTVTVLKGAAIKGNVHGNSVCCDGEIDGNTSVSGKVAIKENSVIKGDISCERISICDGAVCNGKIETIKPEASAKDDGKADLKPAAVSNAHIGIVTDLKKYV